MKLNDIKRAVQHSTHGSRWIATMGIGAVIGGFMAGPVGIATGLGVGALGYPPLIGAVKVASFLRRHYPFLRHHEAVQKEDSVSETNSLIEVDQQQKTSSYARMNAEGIPIANLTDEQALQRIGASTANFAADFPLDVNEADNDNEAVMVQEGPLTIQASQR